MLIGAMMFDYMMSTIGSMVTTMDRQAAAFEEKMDKVKEWMTTRNISRKLLYACESTMSTIIRVRVRLTRRIS